MWTQPDYVSVGLSAAALLAAIFAAIQASSASAAAQQAREPPVLNEQGVFRLISGGERMKRQLLEVEDAITRGETDLFRRAALEWQHAAWEVLRYLETGVVKDPNAEQDLSGVLVDVSLVLGGTSIDLGTDTFGRLRSGHGDRYIADVFAHRSCWSWRREQWSVSLKGSATCAQSLATKDHLDGVKQRGCGCFGCRRTTGQVAVLRTESRKRHPGRGAVEYVFVVLDRQRAQRWSGQSAITPPCGTRLGVRP